MIAGLTLMRKDFRGDEQIDELTPNKRDTAMVPELRAASLTTISLTMLPMASSSAKWTKAVIRERSFISLGLVGLEAWKSV